MGTWERRGVGKRLFVAIDVDEVTRGAVEDISTSLRQDPRTQKLGRATWVNKKRMHLTLHFVADADQGMQDRLRAAVARPLPIAPFTLGFQDLGFFPARGSPRVLWLGISDGLDQVRRVHQEIERRLGSRQGAKDPFNPHLTLARFRDRVSRDQIAEIAAFPAAAGPSPIDRVTLYESRLSPQGPTYVALAEAPLQASK